MINQLTASVSSTGKALVNIFIRSAVIWLILSYYKLIDKIIDGSFPFHAGVIDWFGFCIVLVVFLSFFRKPQAVVKQKPAEIPPLIRQLVEVERFFAQTSLEKDVDYSINRHAGGWSFIIDSDEWKTGGNQDNFPGSCPENCLSDFFHYVNTNKIDFKTLKKIS